ncbi:BsuPI-related putative proteinase inhibitor [Alkalicoccus daliensis]|uniref:Intracellular proteinase inhibitor n=1 Tax=Alkalicoccus daliensis TaxID=745820 RepID=A0A1H0CWM4_9BACI|nr:BsuPI-related putative proteinase inhibitor [Alkalicoccus daliensis]SDN62297.1 Intracellular proteinase inhibitor [Alkalicoccus daliensis]
MKYTVLAAILLLSACGTLQAPENSNNVPEENLQEPAENNVEEAQAENQPEENQSEENTAGNEGEALEDTSFQLEAEKDGSTVHVTMKLLNETEEAKEITFRSGQKYHLVIRTEAGEEVYDYAADMMFTQAIETMTLEPGGEMVFEETWEGEAEGPLTVEAGITADEIDGAAPETSSLQETVTVD